MVPDSFDRIDNMPGEYSITLNPNIPPEQHGRCKVSTVAKEEVKNQMKQMTVKDIITHR